VSWYVVETAPLESEITETIKRSEKIIGDKRANLL